MKLRDFERTGTKSAPRFVTQVRDVSSDETFEMTIAGPEALLRRVLGDATIELTIDSRQSAEKLMRERDGVAADQRKAMWSIAGFDKAGDLFTPEPARARRETSILASIRPVGGEGTPFSISMSTFTVPRGVSFFFFGSFVGFTFGSVVPASGNQDLFLHLFGPRGPIVSASILPLTMMDLVTFAMPFPFVPVFRVFGVATGVCGSFLAVGA